DFHPINDAEVMEALQADPLLYYISTYDRLANELLNDRLQTGHWVSGRYANNERYVTLDSDPQEATCFVLSTIMPPDENILTTLLLSHTLKHHGATRVTALLPYMAYMRQEREEDRHSKATQWVGQITKASGIDAIISVDVHSEEAVGVLGVPLIQLSPFMLFANQIEKIGWHTATLVAPDQGAVHRCEAVRDAGKFTTPIAYFEKKRTPDGVHSTLHGDVSRRAIVIDDILDTGGTLIACCTGLLEAGVEQIIVMVTHGLFTGDKWQQLWQMGVQTIYVTNTVPLPERLANDNIRVLSIAPLLRDAIRDLSRL
ncbi:MAG TPA: ribose-phosphate diphosphokinase, partial [Armatimonadota bacterium]|nr:ribose-phosphate diphosphokinase [Armatimonadota bacterium]